MLGKTPLRPACEPAGKARGRARTPERLCQAQGRGHCPRGLWGPETGSRAAARRAGPVLAVAP